MFFDSETEMIVISGVPGREVNKNDKGKVLEGRDRKGGILPSWLMSQSRKRDQRHRRLHEGRSGRATWPRITTGTTRHNRHGQGGDSRADGARGVEVYGINSWKWYCHADPGQSGGGFQTR